MVMPKERVLRAGRRAVPAVAAKLLLALVQAQRRAAPHGHERVGSRLAHGALLRRQAGDLVADEVSAQGHDGGERALAAEENVEVEEQVECRWRAWKDS